MPLLMLLTRRALAAVVIVALLAFVLFVLAHQSRTDPVHAMLGGGASQQAVAAARHRLGLDRPLLTQYAHYIGGLLHANLGSSYRTRRPVVSDLGEYLPATVELTVYALGLAVALGTLIGVASAGRWPGAGLLRALTLAGASTPAFLLALGGILIFYHQLGWLPAAGRTSVANPPTGPTGLLTVDGLLHGRPGVTLDALRHLVLPALSVATGPAISIGRVLRGSLVDALGSDFARTARAKGLRESAVLLRHALRNSVGPALSMTGLQAGLMFAGVVVVEQVFSWPGIGYYTAQSIPVSDFPAIAGVTLVLGVGYVAINLAVDLLQAAADPRLRR